MLATMDHLALANYSVGETEKGLRMLGRMLEAQVKEFGASDPRCNVTVNKISRMRDQDDSLLATMDKISEEHVFSFDESRNPDETQEESIEYEEVAATVSISKSTLKKQEEEQTISGESVSI